MKKHFFPLSALVMVFFIPGCAEHDWSDTVVTNSSTFEVKFKFRHTKEYTLPVGSSQNFETAAHQSVEYYSPNKRVVFEYTGTNSGATGKFIERASYTVLVNNTLNEPVTLSADGWMDEMAGIPSGNGVEGTNPPDSAHTGKIYTDSPVFSVVTGGYPAQAVYSRSGDDTFTVTIR